jgi:hypothetical protein
VSSFVSGVIMRSMLLFYFALWISTTHAFYPWYPNYRCEEDPDCKVEQRRDLPGHVTLKDRATNVAKPLTFEITQRSPGVSAFLLMFTKEPFEPRLIIFSLEQARIPLVERVGHEVERLGRKYSRHEIPRASPADSTLAKRANQYSVLAPVAPTQTRSAGIYQDGTDFSYFIQAKIGSRGKPLYMLVDTGAGTTWVMGSTCLTTACGRHESYGPSDSATFLNASKPFRISYGSGSVSGSIATDTYTIAGMNFPYQFGVADITSDDFNHFPFDGILGLSMSTGATQNFLQALKAANQLTSYIFGIYIHRASDGPNTGEISFGAVNPAKFTGQISYSPVATQANGDWAIPLDDMSYDGKKAGVTGKLAYIDTGTSYVFGPAKEVAALHKIIPGAATTDGTTFTVPCDSNKPLTFDFNGVGYTISPKDWMSAPSSTGVCTSNIYGHEVVANSWLLGDLFLKNVYAVFDADSSKIGKSAIWQNKGKLLCTLTSLLTLISGFANKVIPPQPATTGTFASKTQTLNAIITPGPGSTNPSTPAQGLSGHETGGTAGTAVAQSGSASPTQSSPGEHLESRLIVKVVCVVAAIVMAV